MEKNLLCFILLFGCIINPSFSAVHKIKDKLSSIKTISTRGQDQLQYCSGTIITSIGIDQSETIESLLKFLTQDEQDRLERTFTFYYFYKYEEADYPYNFRLARQLSTEDFLLELKEELKTQMNMNMEYSIKRKYEINESYNVDPSLRECNGACGNKDFEKYCISTHNIIAFIDYVTITIN